MTYFSELSLGILSKCHSMIYKPECAGICLLQKEFSFSVPTFRIHIKDLLSSVFPTLFPTKHVQTFFLQ